MSDLVERLRRAGYLALFGAPDELKTAVRESSRKAADRIETLEAENKRLREALKYIADTLETKDFDIRAVASVTRARAALTQKENEG
jgi:uncharacterized protein (UPF0335 family)